MGGGVIAKAKAWNIGLVHARGEYVWFLSGDDLVFPNSVHLLCQMYSSYGKANVICAVQYMEENPAGDTIIEGMADKRFIKRTDEKFKNLNAPMSFNNADLYQRLLMTGSRIFNPLLGTKFFRRKFLEENVLRFNENVTTNFELLFVANAFMLSKDVAFLPSIFYIAPRK